MIKKLISMAVAVMMLITASSVGYAQDKLIDIENLNNRDAVELLYNMGIVQGNDDGEFLPNNSVSRVEFAIMVLRMMGWENISGGSHNFSDIPNTHWAYNNVATMSQMGICDGITDTYFGATEKVTFNQAAKMLVSALGYKDVAEQDGGYPDGYINMAMSLGITKGVSVANEELTRIEAACLINNCLDVELGPQRVGEDVKKTVFDLHKITMYDGTVTGTYNAQATGSLTPDEVEIDNKEYKLKEDGIFRCDELFGQPVKYYLKDMGGDKVVICVRPRDEVKSVTIYADDITEVSAGQFKYKVDGKVRQLATPSYDLMNVYYNGIQLKSNEVNATNLNPDEGKVILYDLDENASYETALVTSYETVCVLRVQNEKIYDSYGYHFDMSGYDNIRVYKDNVQVSADEIKTGDVIAIASDKGNSNADIFIARDSFVDGTVKSYRTENGTNRIYKIQTSSGTEIEYRMTANLKKAINENAFNAKSFEIGDTLRFYLNINSRIAKSEPIPQTDGEEQVSTASRRKNDQAYGFIWSVTQDRDDIILEVLTEANKFEKLVSRPEEKIFFGRRSGGSYISTKASADEVYSAITASGTKQIITYSLDEEGYLTELCLADTTSNDKYLCLSSSRTERAFSNKMFGSTYYVDQDTVVFSMPGTWTQKSYSSAGKYNKYFSSGNYHVILYDVSDDGHIGAIVYPSQSITTYSNSTVGSEVYIDPTNSTVMIVSDISVEMVDDKEKTVIKGYENGLYKERVLADTLHSNSDARSLIQQGSIIQYEMNSIDRGRAEKSEDPEEIILFRHILNLNDNNPKDTTWGYNDSLITRISGTTTLNDSGLVVSVAEITGITDRAIKIHSDRDITLMKQEGTSVYSYSRDSELLTPRTLDDLQTGMEIVARQRNNNVIEIIYYE